MKIKLFFITMFAIISFIGATNVLAQHTITLQPGPSTGKGAILNSLYPTTNTGSYYDFISYNWTFSGNEGLGTSLIQFDLSAVPAGVTITSATLSLYYDPTSSNAGQAGTNACYLQKITTPWNENTVTWNTPPSTTTTDEVYLPTSTTSNQDYPYIDVTTIVQGWYTNPSTNYGLLLDLIDESEYNSMLFCSSFNTDSTKRPKLEICYKNNNGIKNIENNNALIYPVPANDKVNIEFLNFSDNYFISILNVNGQELINEQIKDNKTQIDIGYLPNGIYFLRLATDKSVEIRKIVKE